MKTEYSSDTIRFLQLIEEADCTIIRKPLHPGLLSASPDLVTCRVDSSSSIIAIPQQFSLHKTEINRIQLPVPVQISGTPVCQFRIRNGKQPFLQQYDICNREAAVRIAVALRKELIG